MRTLLLVLCLFLANFANAQIGVGGIGSTGGGGGGDYQVVPFSATPTFTCVSNTVEVFQITLTGNVTNSTLSCVSVVGNPSISFKICLDGSAHTFVPPANVIGMTTIGSTANACYVQDFYWDGANAQVRGEMTETGPVGSVIYIYGATSGVQTLKTADVASGAIKLPAGTVDFSVTGGTSQVVKQTSAGGIFTVARLACADLSDAGAGCSGGGGAVTRPTDFNPATQSYTDDDFVSGNKFTPSWGIMDWAINANGSAGTSSWTAAIANHPGVIHVATGSGSATDDIWFVSHFGDYTNGSLLPADTFDILFILRFNNALPDTNTEYDFGLVGDAITVSSISNGIYITKPTAGSDWVGQCISSGTPTTTTALAAVSTGWIVGNIYRKDASTIGFKAATTVAGLAGATEQTCTTNIPTGGQLSFVRIKNATAASRNFDVDFIDVWLKSLTR